MLGSKFPLTVVLVKSTAQAKEKPPLDESTLRRLAVDASCDPRTIKKVYEGQPVEGLAGERARAILIKEGLLSTEAAK